MDSETDLSPERVVTALTDFSPQRPEIWPFLESKLYEVISVEDGRALIREGTKMGPLEIWAVERYEWTPGKVRFTVQESNFCTPGSFVDVTATQREGGGSKLHIEWERVATNLKGYIVVTTIRLTKGAALMDSIKKGLKNYAERS